MKNKLSIINALKLSLTLKESAEEIGMEDKNAGMKFITELWFMTAQKRN